jgi:hypothetical protein
MYTLKFQELLAGKLKEIGLQAGVSYSSITGFAWGGQRGVNLPTIPICCKFWIFFSQKI